MSVDAPVHITFIGRQRLAIRSGGVPPNLQYEARYFPRRSKLLYALEAMEDLS